MHIPQGIGLSLCQTIVKKLDGELRLDPDYDSGVEGSPGARFVIALRKPALAEDAMAKHSEDFQSNEVLKEYMSEKEPIELKTEHAPSESEPQASQSPSHIELPEELSVLFVDDDPMLRKVSPAQASCNPMSFRSTE